MKRSLLLFALVILSFTGRTQYDVDSTEENTSEKEPRFDLTEIKKHTYVGGDISLRFGNLTYIYGAPVIGYDFYKQMSFGLTGIYQLVRWNNNGNISSENTFGAGVFYRYRPLDFLLIQTEFDLLNTVNYSSAPGKRINVPVMLGGVGYAGSLGDRSYYQILLMYDFIDNDNMPLPPLINFFPLYLKYGFTFYLG